ncbi:MAG TPA: polymer-forming cytoskeletal protein [Rhizomicrobium sp.]|nr:polymer-forming cytoskeletal protein [Rhizomicrobium sp.]
MAEKMDQSIGGSINIGAGVEIKGNMIVPGCVSVDGKFEGTLKARDLVVGQSGSVSGQINVETAEIRGTVSDNLAVHGKLTLRSTGSVAGAVSYSTITVEEGGALAGQVEKIVVPAAAEPGLKVVSAP